MDNTLIRAKLSLAQAAINEVMLSLDGPTKYTIKPGDNPYSIIDSAPEGTTIFAPLDFRFEGDFEFRKPVTVTYDGILPEHEAFEDDYPVPTFLGTFLVSAPNVTLHGIGLEGLDRERTILTTGQGTRVERCILKGSPNGQRRGIAVNSANVRIQDGHITNIWHQDDAQAIMGWNGTRTLTVSGMNLEASGENIMFGGADSSSPDMVPDDILIRECKFTKNLAWRTQVGVTVKNLFELKSARNVILEDCELEYSWPSGQTGFAIVLTVRNQDGTAPWSTIENIQIRNNAIYDCAGGIQILGRDNNNPSGRMSGVTFDTNHFAEIDPQRWSSLPSGQAGVGRLIDISGGPKDLHFVTNRMTGANIASCMYFSDVEHPTEGLIVEGNTFTEGEYGVKGDNDGSGTIVLDHFAPGYVWSLNYILRQAGGANIAYPEGTTVINV